ESFLEIRHSVLCRRLDQALGQRIDSLPRGGNQLADDREGSETLIKLGGRVVTGRAWIDQRERVHLQDQSDAGRYNSLEVAAGLLDGKIVGIKERIERIHGGRNGRRQRRRSAQRASCVSRAAVVSVGRDRNAVCRRWINRGW